MLLSGFIVFIWVCLGKRTESNVHVSNTIQNNKHRPHRFDPNDIKPDVDESIYEQHVKNAEHHEQRHEYGEYALGREDEIGRFGWANGNHRPRKHQRRSHYHTYHHGYEQSKRDHKRTAPVATASDTVATTNRNETNSVQRDYMAAVIGKDVQLDCRMKNLANDDDKVRISKRNIIPSFDAMRRKSKRAGYKFG